MVTVGMNYHIVPGKESEFEAVFGKVLVVMSKVGGHVGTRLFRDVANQQTYLILSEWSDRASFEAFTASAQFKSVTEWGKMSILATQPRHEIYETGLTTAARPHASACPVAH